VNSSGKKKRKDKEAKKLERQENKMTLDSDDMIAYVDEFGQITDTPPDPTTRVEVKLEDIEIGIPKKEEEEYDPIRSGIVTFFNESKGFGFIRDLESQESVFVHVNNTKEEIRENNKVRFETEQGPRGLAAIKVEIWRD
jgi:cold shock CspA family protein